MAVVCFGGGLLISASNVGHELRGQHRSEWFAEQGFERVLDAIAGQPLNAFASEAQALEPFLNSGQMTGAVDDGHIGQRNQLFDAVANDAVAIHDNGFVFGGWPEQLPELVQTSGR